MSRITKTEKLPSCEVKIDLLRKLEDYFKNELPGFLYNKSEYLSLNYSLSIEDIFASERFNSVDEYNNSFFTDTTSKALISVKIRSGGVRECYIKSNNIEYYPLKEEDNIKIKEIEEAIPSMSIEMVFKAGSEYPDDGIRMDYDGENARAMITAVYDAIIRIINQYNSNTRIFFPRKSIFVTIILFAIYGPVLSFYSFIVGYKLPGIIIMSLSLIAISYLTLGKITHPYHLFDSKKSERYKRFNNWFLYNAIFIILLNIFLIILRKYGFL